jgi:hypothetical protein
MESEKFKIVSILPSIVKNKKYDVILEDKENKERKKLSFGDINSQHYYDKLGIYNNLDHLNKERRRLFKLRFEKKRHIKHSPSWFSDKYLW